jgi:hypothetical protein
MSNQILKTISQVIDAVSSSGYSDLQTYLQHLDGGSIRKWENTISYVQDDVIIYNNSFYQCLVTNSTVGTFINLEWQLIGGSSNTDELVKMVSSDATGKYLNDLLDHSTIENVGGVLVAKTLQGLTVSIAEINTLQGMTGNVKSVLDSLASAGMTYTGTVSTKAGLNAVTGMITGNVKIVLTDETQSNKRMSYIFDGSNWQSIGEFNVQIRDFSVNPINLTSEITGVLPQTNMNLTDIAKTTDLTSKADKVLSATNEDIATLDINGNLVDGGKKISDLVLNTTTVNGKTLNSNIVLDKSDIGLGSVQNVDTTNASNITSGVLPSAQLPIANGTSIGGVKAGTNITISADGTISATSGGGSLVYMVSEW